MKAAGERTWMNGEPDFNKTDKPTLADLWRLEAVTHGARTQIERRDGGGGGVGVGGCKEGRRAGEIKAKGTPCFIDVCLSTAFQKEANELKQDLKKKTNRK